MNKHTWAVAGAAVLACAALSGCGSMGMGRATATANLMPTGAINPNPTTGKVTFTALDHGVRVAGEVRGLTPGEHGFHIHEKGDCGDNGNASGGHFNPTGGTHGKFGAAGSHAGELPSLVAGADGTARFSVDVHAISLTDGAANNVVGRALIVHRDRDDYTSQPAGNSGPRIACAVITR
ncbi:MAG: superoxide dismutase family protein [Proteobacteria bacterium]|nr:superoxide dismutase family protein [Pseudomonadota bacterium]